MRQHFARPGNRFWPAIHRAGFTPRLLRPEDTAFGRPHAHIGLQDEKIGTTAIWVLPNQSGLNANYRPAELAEIYRELKEWTREVSI